MSRRMLLPTLGGLVLAVYILAPFCWLLLTSFMHEQDALSVPPQWIPKNPTLSNYMTFLDPTGTRAIVGSRAAEQTFPGMDRETSRSEEHTSELQSPYDIVCRLLLEKK